MKESHKIAGCFHFNQNASYVGFYCTYCVVSSLEKRPFHRRFIRTLSLSLILQLLQPLLSQLFILLTIPLLSEVVMIFLKFSN